VIELTAERLEVGDSLEDFNDLVMENGWGDGLPVVPPTPERVEAMLAQAPVGLPDSLGAMPITKGEATLEKIAINAVLAGAKPAFFPVIVAAVEAVMDVDFNLFAIQATTSSATPMVVVNGPVREQLGFNSGAGCLGSGWATNATVGRALRLAMLNIGGGRPVGLGISPLGADGLDCATIGFPGKYSMCAAENEEESPWEPLHVERGFAAEDSTVTVYAVDSACAIRDNASQTAEELLTCLAHAMGRFGSANLLFGGRPAVALAPELADIVARDGWSKRRVQDFLFENARLDFSLLPPNQRERHLVARVGWTDAERLPICDRPEHISVLVMGGPGPHEVFLPTFGSSRPVSKLIQKTEDHDGN
jgi:hypothetical protein